MRDGELGDMKDVVVCGIHFDCKIRCVLDFVFVSIQLKHVTIKPRHYVNVVGRW